MIVKDEEHFIEQCLDSVTGLVDEIIVYDTGSTDRTTALAEAKGARVVRGFWDDDFARARNAALAECTGDWVLHLDADEILEADARSLHAVLDRAKKADALTVTIHNVGVRGGDYDHANQRIFRRAGMHWTGALHEQLVRRDGQAVQSAPLTEGRIVHYGYAEDVLAAQSKSERNLRIAERALAAAGPGDDRAMLLVNLGRSHSVAGDNDAAIRCFTEARELATGVVRTYLLRLGAEILLDLGRIDEARTWIDDFEDAGGAAVMVTFLRGSADLFEGKSGDLLVSLDDLDAVVTDQGRAVSHDVVRERTAMAHAATGNWEKAAPALRAVLATRPTSRFWSAAVIATHHADGDLDDLTSLIPDDAVVEVVKQAVVIADDEPRDAFGHALRRHFGDDHTAVTAFALNHAKRLDDLEAMLPWAVVIRNAGFAESCPLLGRAADPTVPVPERFMAAVVAHASFRDPRALELVGSISELLAPEDEPAAIHVLRELAPDLILTT